MSATSTPETDRIEAKNLDPLKPLSTVTNKDGLTLTKVLLGKICTICTEESKHGDSIYLCYVCRQTYHKQCIYGWLSHDANDSCPCCRAALQLPADVVKAPIDDADDGDLTMGVIRFFNEDNYRVIEFRGQMRVVDEELVQMMRQHMRLINLEMLCDFGFDC